MTHVIKGFIIIAAIIGSIYALSRFISNFFEADEDYTDKFAMFFVTVCGLIGLFTIGTICYLIGGGK